jgi:hypothetical protein
MIAILILPGGQTARPTFRRLITTQNSHLKRDINRAENLRLRFR